MNISPELSTALIGVTVILLGMLGTYLKVKWDEITAKIQNDKIRTTIQTTGDSICGVVAQLNQEIVDDLKAKTTDGMLTQEDIIALKTQALERTKALMSAEAMKLLSEYFNDIDAWILIKVEQFVRDAKTV